MEGEEDDGMRSLSPSGRKRVYDHEGDVEMGDVGNVSPVQALDLFVFG